MRKTGIITAGSIAAVLLAGSVAIGANVGILNATSDSPVGTLGATGDLVEVAQTSTTSTVPVVTSVPAAVVVSSPGEPEYDHEFGEHEGREEDD